MIFSLLFPLKIYHENFSCLNFEFQKMIVCNAFKTFKALVEIQSRYKIKALRTYKGQEYLACTNFFEQHEIQHQLTTRCAPQHIRVVERKNKTIMDIVGCMLKVKQMPKKFWMEAIVIAIYTLNIRHLKKITVEEDHQSNTSEFFEDKEGHMGVINNQLDCRIMLWVMLMINLMKRLSTLIYLHIVSQWPLKKSQRKVMDDKIHATEKNETWELTNLSANKRPIKVKWVYKIKYNSNGEIDCCKKRLVAKGYKQKQGVDYLEKYVLNNLKDR
ncbi:hypothetical protein CR513_34237, partial [Mucuna pruriens]